MATDLADFIDSLRREVTPLGSEPFSAVADDTWTGYLADAFWEARLDGLLSGFVADTDGVVTPDLPRELVALVVLYAGVRVLRNRILSIASSTRYKAGPVEYETSASATALTELLRQLAAIKKRIVDAAADPALTGGITPAFLVDAFTVRQVSPGSYGGWAHELLGITAVSG